MMYICAWQAPPLAPERLISSMISARLARPRARAPPYSAGISAASQPASVSASTNSFG